MLVDLVRIPTRDGCTLDAALERPDGAATGPLDAVCLLHGTGSNFYQSTVLEFFAARFRERGLATLRANTRGHDGISTCVTARGGIRLGAAYEIVDDCRHDVVGLVEWLRANVGPRVALFGHSLGAVKCVYAAVHEPALAPELIVALSPPRLSYATFAASERSADFLQAYERATALVDQGKGGTLLEVSVPLPMVIAAGGYVEKYGPDERYNLMPLVGRLAARTLFAFGAVELANNLAFRGLPEEIAAVTAARAPRDCIVVPGADHFYTGVRPQAWDAIAAALDRLVVQ